MDRMITINDTLDEAMLCRVEQIKGMNINEFVNIAIQNLVNMSKQGIPEAVKITQFNWDNKI